MNEQLPSKPLDQTDIDIALEQAKMIEDDLPTAAASIRACASAAGAVLSAQSTSNPKLTIRSFLTELASGLNATTRDLPKSIIRDARALLAAMSTSAQKPVAAMSTSAQKPVAWRLLITTHPHYKPYFQYREEPPHSEDGSKWEPLFSCDLPQLKRERS